jgi:hypothetical protein
MTMPPLLSDVPPEIDVAEPSGLVFGVTGKLSADGAPVTEEFVLEIGGDGYAPTSDASDLPAGSINYRHRTPW